MPGLTNVVDVSKHFGDSSSAAVPLMHVGLQRPVQVHIHPPLGGQVHVHPMISHQSSPPRDGLGYSRHYARRMRDLGRTSKDSWIQRLWNHMFLKKADSTSEQVKQIRDGMKVCIKEVSTFYW